jgi:hypothetical protein
MQQRDKKGELLETKSVYVHIGYLLGNQRPHTHLLKDIWRQRESCVCYTCRTEQHWFGCTFCVCMCVCVAPQPRSVRWRLLADVSRSNTFRHRETDRQTGRHKHTHTYTYTHTHTESRAALNEWSARRRRRCLHNTQRTWDKYPCPRRDSNRWSQQSGCRPTP